MVQFSDEVLAGWRRKAEAVRKQLAGSGKDFKRWVSFSGGRALAEPGGQVPIRALPRWDFFGKRYAKQGGKTADLLTTGKYCPEVFHVPAMEHWYDDASAGGRRTRDWCRRVLGEQEPCPVCEAAAALAGGGGAEQEVYRDMRPQDVYLYNILVRGQEFGEDGRPAVRILTAPATVWLAISEICFGRTGADQETAQQFARGDISDWTAGYDLLVGRPAGQGDRYKVDCANAPSPVFSKAQAAAHPDCWSVLPGLLFNLEDELLKDVISYEEMYRKVYGADAGAAVGPTGPDPASAFPGRAPAPARAEGTTPEDYGFGTGPAEEAGGPFDPDDPFGGIAFPGEPGPPASGPPGPPARPRPPAPAPPAAGKPGRPAPPRPTGRGRR